jgi:hypothetical protein
LPKTLVAGLFAFGLLACSGSGSRDLASKSGVASDSAPIPVSTARTLAVGTTVQATIQQSVSSRSNTTGDHVNAIVRLNVMDDGGHVVIPGGSAIVLTIAQLAPAKNSGVADGVIALNVTAMTVGGAKYEPKASVGAVPHTLKGRGATQSVVGNTAGADRDVIVTPGTPITITLTQPLKIFAN